MEHVRNRSKKRDAIYAVLQGTTSHPTADWVFQQLKDDYPDLSLGTVYRNLKLFQEEGTVISVANVKGNERYDANTHPHSHFVCESCGKVIDLPAVKLPLSLLQQAADQAGSVPTAWDLNFHGVCPECREKTTFIRVQDSSKNI